MHEGRRSDVLEFADARWRSNREIVCRTMLDEPESMPTLEEVEQRYVRQVLAAVDGNKTRAARILGVDRRTIYRHLERLARR